MGNHDEVEQGENATTSSDSFIDSDEDGILSPERDEGMLPEEPLTEQEIEELIDEYFQVESKAAEAQEALEGESLTKLESEVREELSQSLQGDDLDKAVAEELETYKEEWEAALDEFETESAHLLEQLDGAGVSLPSLFKWIESQAPGTCCTEAWKKRAHWVGSQVTGELMGTVAEAEKHLQTVRPIRRKHGRVLEEGASGFLQKRLDAQEIRDIPAGAPTVDWGSFNKLVSDDVSDNVAAFGSKHWASVYLASTPQQAAQMGLKFPGVDEVEEIDDIDDKSGDPFIADALANERELDLSEEQRKKFRKVKEEDDENLERKLQIQLKKRRQRKKSKKTSLEGVCLTNQETSNSKMHTTNSNMKMPEGFEAVANADFHESMRAKRISDDVEQNMSNKRSRTIIIDSEDEETAVSDSFGDATKLNEQPDLEDKIDSTVGSTPSLSENEKFQCTACCKISEEVHQHPLLKVIVCRSCKILMEEKRRIRDADCSECFCGWCGQSSDLISCKSCDMLFCDTCILRNFGEEYLSKVKLSGWQCCCCSPSVLHTMTLQLYKAIESGDVIVSSPDSDSDTSDSDIDIEIRSKRKQKKIRRIIDDAELGEDTRQKIAIEKERQERLRSLQVQFSARSKMMDSKSSNGIMLEGGGVDVLGDALRGYIVNVVRENGEEAIRIPPSISAKLKAHQLAGIRFMWENIVQSIRKVKSGDKGLGCILAHTMGLGKTFQVIAFLYTAMRSVELGLRNALIVTPVNVLHNWRHEFTKWAPSEFKPLRVFMLDDVSRERRSALLAKWRTKGGVFLISYTAFRNLSFGKHIKDRNMARDIACALQDGPDILICDEAHMIKNTRADTTQAIKLVRCQRRIALTGSPLQNNLMEYYCMVDFVREGFLGSSHEFRNRFQNPIENGQHTNSTADDVKIMNQRSHILYEQLKGFVQRMDMNVVENDLPPKTVYVIAVKLSPLQRKLYKRFLDVHGFATNHVYKDTLGKRSFLAGYQALAQIWNHPGILQLRKDNRDFLRREDAVENFLVDESSSDEEMANDGRLKGMDHSLNGKVDDGFLQKDWWKDLLGENDYRDRDFSGKMVLLLDILTMSADVGDKALVFSQSIPTLDLIELYLSQLPRKRRNGKFWRKSKDWYRLDGSTASSERQKLVEKFNDTTNKRVKCTLISTRAGSLGINLHAANRVIIVDGSWNPTYDLQAIYRAWRYGQTKPVFAYRLMAHGTMEEKIYKRQVTKEGLAARVVDRQQVHRTISKEEMLHLFEFGDDEIPENELVQPQNGHGDDEDTFHRVESAVKQKPSSSCSDKLMTNLLSKYHSRWITSYHEHETLLQENEDEKLSKEEQDMAWEVFQKSLHWEEVQRVAPLETATVKPVSANVVTVKPVLANLPTAKPVANINTAATVNDYSQAKGNFRTRQVQRKCTNLSHLLTLRSQGTKVGCSTVCGECAQEISWENLNRDSHNKLKNGI